MLLKNDMSRERKDKQHWKPEEKKFFRKILKQSADVNVGRSARI